MILGLDASTTCVGWAFSQGHKIVDAGFINISKLKTVRDKVKVVLHYLTRNRLINQVQHINLEAALSGFGGGFTSQKTIISLSRFNAVLEYALTEELQIPVILCNVNTMRKKVLGAARIKGMKPKEYVKMKLPTIIEVKKFDKINRNGEWDAHNSDMYDAVVCSLFG